MMRPVAIGFAAVALASAVVAQPPDPFGRPFAPPDHRGSEWRGDRLASLGQKLFFDPRLSGSGTTACASCHDPRYAFAEPRRVSISDGGRPGRRNAPSLIDVAFRPVLMWDGRFRTLEQQALGPFQGGEMGNPIEQAVHRLGGDPQYQDLFRSTFGQWPTVEGVAGALAAFQRTLIAPPSRVDRFLANNENTILSPQERHGYEVFARRAACGTCHRLLPLRPGDRVHNGPLLMDFSYHNLGVGYGAGGPPDAGRYELSKIEPELGAFRTPSLRNVARTAPYMHDGSLDTLEEVMEFYSAGGRPNPNLSPQIRPLHLDGQEKAALVAFLRALSAPEREY
jgi:cytochrome c peroxidase